MRSNPSFSCGDRQRDDQIGSAVFEFVNGKDESGASASLFPTNGLAEVHHPEIASTRFRHALLVVEIVAKR